MQIKETELDIDMQMNNRVEFTVNASKIVVYFISMNILLTLTTFLAKGPKLLSAVLVLSAIASVSYLTSLISIPKKIVIDEQRSTFEMYYIFGAIRKPRVAPLNEIHLTFNYEVRARGVRSQVLKITHNDKTIAKLLPQYGWDKRTLNRIISSIKGLRATL